jgi:glycosyltransferase involved in cell wall biosynthesis
METLDIGVLIDTVYPFTHGGAEKRYALLGRELSRRGHSLTVYAMNWWQGPRHREDHGIHYVAVAKPRRLYANHARRAMLQPLVYGMRTLSSLHGSHHDLVDANQFPFVHLPPARLGAALQRTPFAITWHEVWRDYWFGYAPLPAALVGMALEDVAPRLATTNIAVSQHTAARLRTMGAHPKGVAVVPNAIDLGRIDRVQPRAEATDLVFAGRLIAHKRVDRLIAAVARLRRQVPTVRCTIVGTGPEERRLQALARGLGLEDHVEFTGSLEDEDELLATMKAAKVFVSASEREGFGIAALEAMACRLPVVTIDHPMNALAGELVLDGYNGLVTRAPRDGALSRALAGTLAQALADEPARLRMAAKARLTAEGYDKRRVAVRLENVYRRTIADHAGEPVPAPIPLPAA